MDKVPISLVLAVVLGLIGVIGDFFIKLSGAGAKFMDTRWFVLGFLVYGLTAFGWFYVMKNIKLSTLGVFYVISTILFLVAISVFYFKEQLNIYEGVGITLAIVSLLILGRFA
jgi:drug/metabolite transporter (DMT)-like permease